MKRMKIPLLLWVIVPTLVALLLRAGLADVAIASSSSASWKIVSSPNGNVKNLRSGDCLKLRFSC